MKIKHKNAKARAAYHSAKLYKKRKLAGVCLFCGKERDADGNYCLKCLKKAADRRKRYINDGLCSCCGKLPLKSKTRCVNCLKRDRNFRHILKEEIIKEYGGECKCCGVKNFEFLTLEHSQNDGSKHRKSLGIFGSVYYKWLRDNNFPKDLGLEILCMNCNFSRGKYGYCPHEKRNKK